MSSRFLLDGKEHMEEGFCGKSTPVDVPMSPLGPATPATSPTYLLIVESTQSHRMTVGRGCKERGGRCFEDEWNVRVEGCVRDKRQGFQVIPT